MHTRIQYFKYVILDLRFSILIQAQNYGNEMCCQSGIGCYAQTSDGCQSICPLCIMAEQHANIAYTINFFCVALHLFWEIYVVKNVMHNSMAVCFFFLLHCNSTMRWEHSLNVATFFFFFQYHFPFISIIQCKHIWIYSRFLWTIIKSTLISMPSDYVTLDSQQKIEHRNKALYTKNVHWISHWHFGAMSNKPILYKVKRTKTKSGCEKPKWVRINSTWILLRKIARWIAPELIRPLAIIS